MNAVSPITAPAPAAAPAAIVAPIAPITDPFAEAMPPLRLFLGFRGRMSRRQFWLYGVLALLGMALLGHALLGIARVPPRSADLVVNLLLLWPALAVSVKRWHDRDKSGWWVLLNLLPIVGWLWALSGNGLLRGTPGPNRHGADPLTEPQYRPVIPATRR